MSACQHLHGAWVKPLGLWVCGLCYAKLPNCPVKYGMVPPGNMPGAAPLQQIIWQAELRFSAQRTTLASFIEAIARRMMYRTAGLSLTDACGYAIDELAAAGVEFGDTSQDWSRMAAVDWAEEAMTYWEEAEGNG